MKIVRVTWGDAANGAGWRSLKDIAKERPLMIESVGFLVKRNKRRIVLAHSVGGDDGLGSTVIPAAWVKRVDILHT